MITNDIGNLAFRFIGLIVVQVLILNNLIVFGQYIPFILVLLLFWFPMYIPKSIMMVVAFFLGLIIDVFTDTVAFHAFSMSTIAYLRPSILKFCFGNNIEFQNNHFQGTSRAQRLSFLFILLSLEAFLFFVLEIFNFSHILLIFNKTVLTTFLSFGVSLIVISIIPRNI